LKLLGSSTPGFGDGGMNGLAWSKPAAAKAEHVASRAGLRTLSVGAADDSIAGAAGAAAATFAAARSYATRGCGNWWLASGAGKASQQHRCSHQDSASCQGSNGHPELAVALRLSLQLLSLLAGIGSPACLRAILTPAGSLVALLKRLSHQGSQVARQRKPLSEVDQKCRSPRQCC